MVENSKWIWADCEYSVNQYADFLLEFDLEEVDENAILEISVDGEYTAYINDGFAGCGQYHDYPFEKSYDTLCVGEFLKKGLNRLRIGAYCMKMNDGIESAVRYATAASSITVSRAGASKSIPTVTEVNELLNKM